MNERSRVIVALDDMTLGEATAMAARVKDEAAGVKAGFELVSVAGARAIIGALQPLDVRLFMDVKLYDIPSTVAKTVKRLMKLGAWMINMHVSGGPEMMRAARAAVDEVWDNLQKEAPELMIKPRLIGVTILTSMKYSDLTTVLLPVEYTHGEKPGNPVPVAYSDTEQAEKIRALCIKMALAAKECGLNGVVTSPQEAAPIRAAIPDPTFEIVTPGIRSEEDAKDDQVRIATAAAAIDSGATWLVVGRPITKAKDPFTALETMNQQVVDALAKRQAEKGY